MNIMSGLHAGRPLTLVLITGFAPERMDRLCSPTGLRFKVYRGSFPVDKAAGKHGADHTPPSRAEVTIS